MKKSSDLTVKEAIERLFNMKSMEGIREFIDEEPRDVVLRIAGNCLQELGGMVTGEHVIARLRAKGVKI